jgi:hypothetical protein
VRGSNRSHAGPEVRSCRCGPCRGGGSRGACRKQRRRPS